MQQQSETQLTPQYTTILKNHKSQFQYISFGFSKSFLKDDFHQKIRITKRKIRSFVS
jgi:hypothetical protein